MTDVQIWAEFTRLGLAFAAIVGAYVGPLRWARTAAWRQDLFAIRNELWDRMQERGTLHSPAHIKVRQTLNAAIRVAPVLNLWWFSYMVLRCPMSVPKDEPKIPTLIAEVTDPDAAAALRDAYDAVASHLIRRLIWTTFPGVLIGISVLVADHCFRAAKFVARTRNAYQDRVRELMGELEMAGRAAVPA